MNTSSWLRGNPVTIVQRWYRRDVLTEAVALADPTLTIFTVEAPDGTLTAYTSGVDSEVTHASTGVYVLALDPPAAAGVYHWRAQASGAVVGADEGTFEILESFVLAGGRQPGYGPCQPWIGASDVVTAIDTDATDADAWRYETAADIGSTLMFDLSGRQFPGVCETTIRPCSDGCNCLGASQAAGLWLWGGTLGGYGGGWWANECGDRCGCGVLSKVRLVGFPVREIISVTIDGLEVDADTYTLREERDLVALNGTRWPSCQRLDLNDGPGTFFVRYRVGVDPPPLGRLAAAELAAELFKAITPGSGECKLPRNATRIVRQGVTVEKIATLAQVFQGGATGLPLVDAFLATANPTGMRRPPAIYSPDLPRSGFEV